MDGSGINGFVGTRASLMLDVVFLAMFAVLPLLGWSIWLVKRRGNVELHKHAQLALSAVLLITARAFEIDMRLNYWKYRAEASPYYPDEMYTCLCTHLFFAIPTAVCGRWSLRKRSSDLPICFKTAAHSAIALGAG
jgi:hypothetical protein